MRSSRYSTSRQKSCMQCSVAKAKCDRRGRGCLRCANRGLGCTYPQLGNSPNSRRGALENEPMSQTSVADVRGDSFVDFLDSEISLCETPSLTRALTTGVTPFSAETVEGNASIPSRANSTLSPGNDSSDRCEFTGLDLVCPIDVSSITNRWLNAYVSGPEQVLKKYEPKVYDFICQILKSYVSLMVRGRGTPPFIHWAQLATPSLCPLLTTCASVVRICDNMLPGSEETAIKILQREMAGVYEQRDEYDDISLLAAFQAYLVYAMVLFFRLDIRQNSFHQEATVNLQELACLASKRGLMSAQEQQRSRPRWESWIVAEAKRRTLFTMYLFDNILSREQGLPTFLGTELKGLPAPTTKSLWEGKLRREWELAYNMHLVDWPAGFLCIDELWNKAPEIERSSKANMNDRVDRWLEDLDGFGVMIYAVTSYTHGG